MRIVRLQQLTRIIVRLRPSDEAHEISLIEWVEVEVGVRVQVRAD